MDDASAALVDERTRRTGTSQNQAILDLIRAGHDAEIEAARRRAREHREKYRTIMDHLA